MHALIITFMDNFMDFKRIALSLQDILCIKVILNSLSIIIYKLEG
jgi:hypothetical protein